MDLVDLYPDTRIYTSVGDLIFKLRLFDLHAVVWAESYGWADASFIPDSDRGGLNAMYYILGDSDNYRVFATIVTNIAYYLAEDLNINLESFVAKINEKNPPRAIAILSESVKAVLKKSFPDKDNTGVSGGEIFNSIVKDKKPDPTNWAKVYSDFYRFGGMSRNEFFSMTMRQIDEIYTQIDESRTREKIENMQFHCSIRGIKKQHWPKMPLKKSGTKNIDNDEIKRRQEEHQKLFESLRNGDGNSN
jgi:hypothetical protein